MIDLSNGCLLMIEPTKSATIPVQDVWTRRARGLVFEGKLKQGKSWRGSHSCICGAASQSYEVITPQGRITNSLLVHYIECHRDEVPEEELIKLYAEYMDWSIEEARQHYES